MVKLVIDLPNIVVISFLSITYPSNSGCFSINLIPFFPIAKAVLVKRLAS